MHVGLRASTSTERDEALPATGHPRRVFHLLDALRGLAAIIVVWVHLGTWNSGYHPAMAGVSVDLFFAISGFVIAHSYESRLLTRWSLGQFFLVRLIRLYPMYALGVAFAAAAPFVFPIARDAKATLVQGLMLPYPAGSSLYPLNGPAWSLLFELIINVLYAASVRLWTRTNIMVLMLLSGMSMLVLASKGYSLDAGWNWSDFPMGLARVTYGFAAGVLIFRFARAGWPIPALPPLVIVGLCILPIILPPLVDHAIWRSGLVLVWLPVCVALAVGSRPVTAVTPYDLLGRLSYPIYALHYPLIFLVGLTFAGAVSGYPLALAVTFTCAIIVASLVAEATLDRPLRRWLALRLVRA